jgi:hypothetical protein
VKAKEKLKEVAQKINENKGHADELAKMHEVESKLKGLSETLITPSRRWIREGFLQIVELIPKPGFVVLFNDLLVIAIKSSKEQYKVKHTFPLDNNLHLEVISNFLFLEIIRKLPNSESNRNFFE